MITLETLPQAEAIEVFNQVKEHLLKQGVRSLLNGRCAYRSPDGTKCAAGCLIGDDEYDYEDIEQETWDALVMRGFAPPHHERLISSLQYIHDGYAPSEWEVELDKLEKDVLAGKYPKFGIEED